MSKSRRNKHYKGQLAVTPNINNTSGAIVAGVKSEKFDKNGGELSGADNVGRDSYELIAKRQGLYYPIQAQIRKFRQEHIESSFRELYEYIQPLFPTVWTDEKMAATNFKKKIEGSKEWCEAYYNNQSTLIDLANNRLFDVINNTEDEKIVVSAYDKIMKYKLALQELENIDSKEDTVEFVFGLDGDDNEEDS